MEHAGHSISRLSCVNRTFVIEVIAAGRVAALSLLSKQYLIKGGTKVGIEDCIDDGI